MASTHQNVTKFAQIALLSNAACRPAALRVVDERGRPGAVARSTRIGPTGPRAPRPRRDVHDGATQPCSWCAQGPRLPGWHNPHLSGIPRR